MLVAHPRGEDCMRKVLATLVALSLVMAMFTGVFAPVPGARADGPPTVDLKSVVTDNFVILSEQGITDVPTSSITGNIGTYPITGAAIGVPQAEVTGTIYSRDAAGPAGSVIAPSLLNTATIDMEAAYNNAANRTPGTGVTNLNVGDGTLSGQNFVPGTYTWNTPGDVTITGDITLTGTATDVWIFQISGTLGIDAGKKIILNGAQAKNVFWQVAGHVELFTTSHFEGNILAWEYIAMDNGASINGRLLSHTAVTLIANTVGLSSAELPGTITVIKNTVGGNGTFHFTVSDDVYNVVSTFDIPTTTVGQGTVGQGIYYVPVTAGTYYVTEGALPAGWVSNDPSMVQTATVDDGTVAAAVYFNNNAMGTLEVIKHTTGGNGTFHFTVSGGVYDVSPFDITTDGGIGSYTVPVIAGSYTVTEGTLPAGWVATGDTAMDVIVPINGTGTATFANNIIPPTPTPTGTITIIKDTVPNGPQDFSFTTTGGLYATVGANVYATTFSLVDDTDADSTHLNTQVFSGVLPGTYTVTEAAAEGYTLDSIVGATSLDLPTGIATIELAAGESATVTFTNNITPTPPVVTPPVVTPPVVTPPVVTPPVVTPPVVTPTTVYHQTFFIGYPDGTFKPDRNVSRAEVAAALTRALGLGWSDIKPSYPDVPATHWSSGNIQIMKDEGIMIGDVSGTFRPDAFITRAEAATLVLRMLKIAPIQNLVASSFKDVPVTNWAVGYIEAMQKNGLITGYPDGTYKPTVNILRSEFAALANRALGRGIGSSSQTAGLAASVHWPDVPATYWAYLDILEASTPHTVVNAVKLNRTIVLKTKTIPLFSDGASTVTIHKVGDVLTAIVPVDGLLPNGSLPAARQVTVVITIKLKP